MSRHFGLPRRPVSNPESVFRDRVAVGFLLIMCLAFTGLFLAIECIVEHLESSGGFQF